MPNWLMAQDLGLGAVVPEIVVQAASQRSRRCRSKRRSMKSQMITPPDRAANSSRNLVGGFHVGLDRGFGVGVVTEFPAVHVESPRLLRCCRSPAST